MEKFDLVQVGRKTFVMLNSEKLLTNKMCNPSIFENEKDANLDICVFEFFKVKKHIICKNLDFRTTRAKNFVKQYGFFSVSELKNCL